MTSVGDTSGYSIAWFAPRQTFHAGVDTSVSFDVNVTDLGARQWWEVSLVPVGTPFLATVDFVAETADIDVYDRGSVVVGKGPFGNDGNIVTQGVRRDPLGYGHVCGGFAADPEGCASKAIRRTFTITDNLNGTITFDYLGERYTYPGEFPETLRGLLQGPQLHARQGRCSGRAHLALGQHLRLLKRVDAAGVDSSSGPVCRRLERLACHVP